MSRPLRDLSGYVGLPFKADGLDRRGLHCWGLVRLVLKEQCGIDLPAYGDVSAADLLAVSRRMEAGQVAEDWRQVYQPRAFDVVLMRAHGRPATVHCGIMADHSTLLHVEEATDSVLVPLQHPMIRHRLAGFFRHGSFS
ncbi:phage tail protein [Zhengella mangrovi]|uniref:Phage tail protein n=1 Tax=Zhengella mangrovi TaxID=1982044 RepID=A0A2G1QRL4_9HYPH|nr:NlpC/P60 family protein [Zhengella mangrovi]PHP68176.1 phage tail protein [Zhengella mangrovi]